MKVIITRDYEELSERASQFIVDIIESNPAATLGLATGGTPLGLYGCLVAKYKAQVISFHQVKTYNLDEYYSLPKTHPQSYYFYMHWHLFNNIDIQPENINIPEGTGKGIEILCREYNEKLRSVAIDLQILGIGNNGHIGFNEPGTPFDQETHIVELTPATREANKRFFNSLEEVPRYAITMGIKNIMKAKKILLLASGVSKARAIRDLVAGPVTETLPASALKQHPDATVIVDQEAASMIK